MSWGRYIQKKNNIKFRMNIKEYIATICLEYQSQIVWATIC